MITSTNEAPSASLERTVVKITREMRTSGHDSTLVICHAAAECLLRWNMARLGFTSINHPPKEG